MLNWLPRKRRRKRKRERKKKRLLSHKRRKIESPEKNRLKLKRPRETRLTNRRSSNKPFNCTAKLSLLMRMTLHITLTRLQFIMK
jgi:hypothetical protein